MTEEIEQVEVDDAPEIEADIEQEAPDQEAPEAPSYDPDVADDARLFGWKSPDEWQGEKPPGYIEDPQEFLDRVQRSKIFQTMQEKLQSQEQAQAEAMRKLSSMQERALEQQRRQYETEMQRVVAAQRQAVEDADPERWEKLERYRQGMQAPQAEQAPQGPPPEVMEYAQSERGEWMKNPLLLEQARQLIDKSPAALQMPASQQLEYAEAEMRKMYPSYFPDAKTAEQPKPKPARVDAGGLATGAVKQSAFAKLPADAKAQFKKFVEKGIFQDTKADQEEYANEYNAA